MNFHKLLLILVFALSTVFVVGCASLGEEEDIEEPGVEEVADEDFGDFEEDEVEETEGEEEIAEEAEEVPPEELTEEYAEETAEEFAEEPVAEETLAEEPVNATSIEEGEPVTITGIDYISNESGGLLQVSTSGTPGYSSRYNPNTKQFVVEVNQATLPDALKRPFILKEFESAFGAVNAYQNPGSPTARIVIQMRTDGEPILQSEAGKLFVMPAEGTVIAKKTKKEDWEKSYDTDAAKKDEEILGAKTMEEFLAGNVKFYGSPISIETTDADIRDVIKFISEEKGVNLVLADDVQGSLSLKLRDVPWDQALVMIMRNNALGYVRQGTILRITKLETLKAEAETSAQLSVLNKAISPLKVKVVPISYATPADLVKQVGPFLTPNRGKVVADERTSSLIVTDTIDILERLERLIRELDIPPAQVMIEGKIVEAQESFTRSLGVNWSFGDNLELTSSGGKSGSPIRLGVTGNIGGNITNASSSLGVTFGTLDVIGSLQAQLGLAETDRLVKIISSPRIVTLNRTEATISQVTQTATLKQSFVGSTDADSVVAQEATFRDLTLSLVVTPQITAEGSVIMAIDVQRQFVGGQITGTNETPINTRSAKTTVLVDNGQTAVIGGIYQSDETKSESGVPYLRNIPVFGWLFKGEDMTKEKNELLVFLTPRILNAKDQRVTE